jgi:hypothetical protein
MIEKLQPNNFKTGCYNMLCSGFVQTDQSYHLGGRVTKTSTYGGEMIEMPISIYQVIIFSYTLYLKYLPLNMKKITQKRDIIKEALYCILQLI